MLTAVNQQAAFCLLESTSPTMPTTTTQIMQKRRARRELLTNRLNRLFAIQGRTQERILEALNEYNQILAQDTADLEAHFKQ